MTHGSGVTNRGGINVGNHSFGNSNMNGIGGSISGISPNSATGNRSSVPGLGVSPVLGNVGPRLASSMGTIVGGGNLGRNISSGGLSVPGLASRVNLATNSGSGSLNVQGPNRLISGMLQQGSLIFFKISYLHDLETLFGTLVLLICFCANLHAIRLIASCVMFCTENTKFAKLGFLHRSFNQYEIYCNHNLYILVSCIYRR